ncbi:MAG: branched-chain amino acid transport system substrate-binding protein, partial [Actinomycetota bacterium]|nr:branched-chain amino acid transport system substrate-binding protein [Actinomycetota bacterium]
KQIRDAGITVPWVSDDGANDPKLVASAGAAAAEGALMTCPCGDITANPAAKSFVTDYTAAAGGAPGTYSAEAFDATNFLLAAIDAGKTTAKDINDYVSTQSFEGLAKTLKFDSKGEVAATTIYVYEVKGGKVVFDGSVDKLVGG